MNIENHIVEVRVPQLSESVSEATLVNWHKQVGEAVSEGENLIDIETDKVVLELSASKSGLPEQDHQGRWRESGERRSDRVAGYRSGRGCAQSAAGSTTSGNNSFSAQAGTTA